MLRSWTNERSLALALALVGSALLLGCSGGGAFEDASPPAGDVGLAGSDSASPGDVEKVNAPDKALPKGCPCPLDSYCDLNTNTCVWGCRNNEHCSQGKYCDTAASLCKTGCRTTADCPDDSNPCTDLACTGGSCAQLPNTAPCADDGNSCTADVCSSGACSHPPVNNGKLCGKTLDCSDYRCSSGACVESFFKAGTSCPDDNDGCTADACDGKGLCSHTTVADGTACPNTWGGWDAKCFAGKCYPKRYQCCGSSSLTYLNFTTKKTESWTGTTSCGCSSGTMKWSGWYSGYFLNHSEYCTSCESKAGDYCQSCYDLP